MAILPGGPRVEHEAPPWNARPQLILDGITFCIAEIPALWAILFVYCTVRKKKNEFTIALDCATAA